MTLYTTPLQFGYFFSILMALLFGIRAYKEERLSDGLFGLLMLILALELQDYTFGFAGINVLWEELNGFPRGVQLLFGPCLFLYLKSQINQNFRLHRKHLFHLVPWLTYFLVEFSVFVLGTEAVNSFQSSTLAYWLNLLNYIARIASYALYFFWSLNIYKDYRKWSEEQFSNQDSISFKWYRNFIYLMMTWIIFREVMGIIDGIYHLDFYEDWWWNLALAFTSFYVGIQGYSQKQNRQLVFEQQTPHAQNNQVEEEKTIDPQLLRLAQTMQKLMQEERLYLQAELSLQELAKHLNTNSRELSNCINQVCGQNFNDYVNGLRITAFEERIKEKDNEQFTLLSIAFDCGFNSKATFNRAFKKSKGLSPKQFIDHQ